jgi:hypothetical protein
MADYWEFREPQKYRAGEAIEPYVMIVTIALAG